MQVLRNAQAIAGTMGDHHAGCHHHTRQRALDSRYGLRYRIRALKHQQADCRVAQVTPTRRLICGNP
jgi:hypothetical protein